LRSRAGIVMLGAGTVAGLFAAIAAPVEHMQPGTVGTKNDLGREPVLTVLVLPLAGFELAVDVDLRAFAQVVFYHGHLAWVEDGNAGPGGVLRLLRRRSVRRDHHSRDLDDFCLH